MVSALIKDRPPAPVRNTAGRGPALISTASPTAGLRTPARATCRIPTPAIRSSSSSHRWRAIRGQRPRGISSHSLPGQQVRLGGVGGRKFQCPVGSMRGRTWRPFCHIRPATSSRSDRQRRRRGAGLPRSGRRDAGQVDLAHHRVATNVGCPGPAKEIGRPALPPIKDFAQLSVHCP